MNIMLVFKSIKVKLYFVSNLLLSSESLSFCFDEVQKFVWLNTIQWMLMDANQ